jgi:hypothetical protein
MMINQKHIRILIGYYGLLQFIHFITLVRAGILILIGDPSPFPILPPPSGWNVQTMPFLFGLAGMDIVGILLGIFFSYQMVVKKVLKTNLGKLSLTIFITGAIVFGFGTILNGAWAAHPIAYGIMLVLFLPALLLFFQLWLIRQS